MPPWRRNRRYIALLAAISAAILILGVLFRPSQAEVDAIVPVAPTEISRLERMSIRNTVHDIAQYFADQAALLGGQVVRLAGAERSAVVWGPGRIVSSGGPERPLPEDRGLGREGGGLDLELERFMPHRPVISYRTVDAERLASNVRYPADFYEIGGWALALWRGEDDELNYELGQFLGAAAADCDGFTGTQLRLNIDLRPEMTGGAVFDYDGALMGLVARCGGDTVALDAATVEAAVAATEQVEDRLAGGFGLVVGAPSEQECKALSVADGLLVRQIWRGYQAAAAGLLPGDVIVALDGEPVAAAADLERMTLPIAREVFDLTVIRSGRKRELRVKARTDGRRHFGPAGVAWTRPPAGLPIQAVAAESRLAKAGVRAGDRLLRIGGRRAESAERIEEALAGGGEPLFAVFERDGRLWGALL